jgi:hypothetical protein
LSVVVPGSAQVMSTRAVLHVAGHTGVDVLI